MCTKQADNSYFLIFSACLWLTIYHTASTVSSMESGTRKAILTYTGFSVSIYTDLDEISI